MENTKGKKAVHESAIPQYKRQAKLEAGQPHEEKIRDFFRLLYETLPDIDAPTYSAADKNHLPRAFGKSIRSLLLPDIVIPEKEIELGKFDVLKGLPAEASFLKKKRPDYVIANPTTKKIVILELKTNISFNDFSAALVQAALIKKHLVTKAGYQCYMASIHMSRWLESLDKYEWINDQFERPLNKIWVFSSKKDESVELRFDVEAIKDFRTKVTSFLLEA